MGQILHDIIGFMLMGVLGLLTFGLMMLIIFLIIAALNDFVFDGKLTPIIKNRIQKLFRLA